MQLKQLIVFMFILGCSSVVFSGELEERELPVADETSAVLINAAPGASVEIPGFDMESVPRLEYRKVVLPGPQYIISDDPEYIREPEGIAVRESVEPGRVRLYVYNVNGVKDEEMPRRISAVIENTGDAPMNIRMLRSAFPKPSGNYQLIGKTGLEMFFTSSPDPTSRSVEPGQAVAIDPEMEATITNYNDLVHGLYEFVTDQPGIISVVQTDPDTPGPEAAQRIDEIIPSPRKNAGRGIFGVSNYLVLPQTGEVLDPAKGPVQLVLADGEQDPWIVGLDSSTGEVAELKGNYGVMYDVELPMKSTDPELGYALVTYNIRFGSPWCDAMANTIKMGKGIHPAGIVSIPADKLNTKSFPEVVLLQLFPPGQEQITFTYSPPGASCLPTPLVFIPVRINNKAHQTD